MPNPRSCIFKIPAYVAGEAEASGAAKIYKMSSNESALGPSPKAIEAYQDIAGNLSRYPDPKANVLRQTLASHHGLDAENIVCGAGSEDLLASLVRAYVEPGDDVVYSQYGFLAYRRNINSVGGNPISVKEQNYTADIDALIAAITPKTKILFLANPNNPTGTLLPFSEIECLHRAIPEHVLLVMDAAYAEFVDHLDDYDCGKKLIQSGAENVVVTRTFSKAYGLANLRVGWSFAPEKITDALNRVRGVFNVTGPAQVAAVAALNDHQHTQKILDYNAKGLQWLKTELTKLRLEITPSVTNFLLVHFPDANIAKSAFEYLKTKGVIVRPVAAYGLAECLRVTVGSEEDNMAFIRTLTEFHETIN